jgi:hypothetical protein
MEDVAAVLGEEVAKVHTTPHRTGLTHDDLAPRSIIARNGRVAALVDWGFGGWSPECWELPKGHYDFFPKQDWSRHFFQAMSPYDLELIAERARWEMLPEPGKPAASSLVNFPLRENRRKMGRLSTDTFHRKRVL